MCAPVPLHSYSMLMTPKENTRMRLSTAGRRGRAAHRARPGSAAAEGPAAARSVHLDIVDAPGAVALADGRNGRPGLRADRRGCEGRKFPVAADARALVTAASAHGSSHARAYPRSAVVAAHLDLTRRVERVARNNRRMGAGSIPRESRAEGEVSNGRDGRARSFPG